MDSENVIKFQFRMLFSCSLLFVCFFNKIRHFILRWIEISLELEKLENELSTPEIRLLRNDMNSLFIFCGQNYYSLICFVKVAFLIYMEVYASVGVFASCMGTERCKFEWPYLKSSTRTPHEKCWKSLLFDWILSWFFAPFFWNPGTTLDIIALKWKKSDFSSADELFCSSD